MGEAGTPAPAKLVVAMIAGRAEAFEQAGQRLCGAYGPIDQASAVVAFDFTDYYLRQMGPALLRKFLAFERLIDPADLADIKRHTNELEADLAGAAPQGPARPINLDPGYITESKLVLASTKDFAHRVYLRGGIYAEVTLSYVRGRWASHPYTFPDYAGGTYDAFLTACRDALRAQLGRKETRA